MSRFRTLGWMVFAFALAVALSVYAHKAAANQVFSGPGLFISQNACTDIGNPVSGQTWCFDSLNEAVSVWDATMGAYKQPFVPTITTNFNNQSIVGVGGLQLVQLPPPSSVLAQSTCSGTCATTYTYEVTCLNQVGETLPSAAVTATNASSLSGANFNTISWASEASCTGYNVYGRVSGSLGRLSTLPLGTTSFVDNGSSAGAVTYNFTFSAPSNATVAVWDLRNALNATPVDVLSQNTGSSASPGATHLTTNFNNDTQIPFFGVGSNSGVFSPPSGFSNTVNVNAATHAFGIWGGTKNISTAGTVAAVTSSTTVSKPWSAINIAIAAANPSTPITVEGSLSAVTASPYTALSFSDPSGTAGGDLEVACLAFANGTLSVPQAGFSLIASATFESGAVQVNCYTNLPNPSQSPPSTNTTGTLSQQTATGVFRETLLGLQTWSANTANSPNGAASTAQISISYPVDMTVLSCRATWFQYSGCSPFPTFAIKDTTAGTVLCSSGAVSGTNTDEAITPSNLFVPANDVIAFLASSAGSGCSAGQAAMSIVMHE